ncbi:hypothetical protein F4778DRAFT_787402 [Xylariomycetidae sp. FL2044]|nr:hypothetical protein F4778DRAFT_787402 [Xylariomycetidae sp. FL2044]
MQIRFVLALCSLAGMAAANCREGENKHGKIQAWGVSRKFANATIGQLCKDGTFNGRYQKDEKREYFYHAINSGRYIADVDYFKFGIQRIKNDDARDLGTDECIDGLSKEVNGCFYGGTSSYSNWKYNSEPFKPGEGGPVKDIFVE